MQGTNITGVLQHRKVHIYRVNDYTHLAQTAIGLFEIKGDTNILLFVPGRLIPERIIGNMSTVQSRITSILRNTMMKFITIHNGKPLCTKLMINSHGQILTFFGTYYIIKEDNRCVLIDPLKEHHTYWKAESGALNHLNVTANTLMDKYLGNPHE